MDYGDRVFTLPTIFSFDSWPKEGRKEEFPGIEWVYSYDQGIRNNYADGRTYCGTPEQWLLGPLTIDPKPGRNPITGYPVCCSYPSGLIQVIGGLLLDGSAAFLQGLYYPGAGGLLLDGSAAFLQGLYKPGSGGVVIGGTGTASQTWEFTSSGTWNCPSGVTSVTIECWGKGGNGGNGSMVNSGGGGGGGGYSKKINLAVTPGNTYTVNLGTDTWFSSITTVLAKDGGNGISGTPGSGGMASSGVGDTKFSGGTGQSGLIGPFPGGGGGSSAGTGANGNNAFSQTGATAPSGGGNGGNGGNVGANGSPGFSPGGAGGGGGRGSPTTTGGAGAAGKVKIVG